MMMTVPVLETSVDELKRQKSRLEREQRAAGKDGRRDDYARLGTEIAALAEELQFRADRAEGEREAAEAAEKRRIAEHRKRVVADTLRRIEKLAEHAGEAEVYPGLMATALAGVKTEAAAIQRNLGDLGLPDNGTDGVVGALFGTLTEALLFYGFPLRGIAPRQAPGSAVPELGRILQGKLRAAQRSVG